MSIPVHVVRGKKPGPVLCVTAAMHGDEVNGVEIIRRLLKRKDIRKLKGTLLAMPIVNVFGFLHQTRYLMDRRDLNRSFPGSEKGSIASRISFVITKEIMQVATHFIDLHTGSLHRSNLPQVRVSLERKHTEAMEIAKAFKAPVIVHTSEIEGTFRKLAVDRGLPFIVYEAGEALRFDEISIKTGIQGILGVMHHLDMLETTKIKHPKVPSAIATSSYWVRAPISGILRPYKGLGRSVKKGDILATISNPSSNEEHKLKSPLTGIVITISNLPLVHEGAALFHIACFEAVKDSDIEESIKSLKIAYGTDLEFI